jgi:hypothetical protein
VRDLVEWKKRHDELHHLAPMEIDGETISEGHDEMVVQRLLNVSL